MIRAKIFLRKLQCLIDGAWTLKIPFINHPFITPPPHISIYLSPSSLDHVHIKKMCIEMNKKNIKQILEILYTFLQIFIYTYRNAIILVRVLKCFCNKCNLFQIKGRAIKGMFVCNSQDVIVDMLRPIT